MTHVRKQIRDAIVAMLIGATGAGDKVYSNRARPIDTAHCPCIVVNTDDETIATIPDYPAWFERKLTVTIYIYAAQLTGLDDVLDEVSAQVEATLWQHQAASTLNGLLSQSMLFNSLKIEFDGETSDVPIGRLAMEISAHYYTESNDPNNFTS
jgi:hypothetical protein